MKDTMFSEWWNPKQPIKQLLALIIQSSKVTGYRLIKKPIIFLHTSGKYLGNELISEFYLLQYVGRINVVNYQFSLIDL